MGQEHRSPMAWGAQVPHLEGRLGAWAKNIRASLRGEAEAPRPQEEGSNITNIRSSSARPHHLVRPCPGGCPAERPGSGPPAVPERRPCRSGRATDAATGAAGPRTSGACASGGGVAACAATRPEDRPQRVLSRSGWTVPKTDASESCGSKCDAPPSSAFSSGCRASPSASAAALV